MAAEGNHGSGGVVMPRVSLRAMLFEMGVKQ